VKDRLGAPPNVRAYVQHCKHAAKKPVTIRRRRLYKRTSRRSYSVP
jgi:hypothetical protein